MLFVKRSAESLRAGRDVHRDRFHADDRLHNRCVQADLAILCVAPPRRVVRNVIDPRLRAR